MKLAASINIKNKKASYDFKFTGNAVEIHNNLVKYITEIKYEENNSPIKYSVKENCCDCE